MFSIIDNTVNKGDNMAKGISLEELDGNIKPNVIPLKKPKKLDRKPKNLQPKGGNDRDIVYDVLFDQYVNNNNSYKNRIRKT